MGELRLGFIGNLGIGSRTQVWGLKVPVCYAKLLLGCVSYGLFYVITFLLRCMLYFLYLSMALGGVPRLSFLLFSSHATIYCFFFF